MRVAYFLEGIDLAVGYALDLIYGTESSFTKRFDDLEVLHL